ncbi:fimbrial protein [Klebsiella pneumoniae]|nr:fimbrial protein [Klebsiella pneumoniae]
MSLRKLLTLFIVLMALGTTSSWASCTRLSSPTVMLDMVVGRVVVPPDLPVGSVILTRDWTMSAPGGASYRCTSGTNRHAFQPRRRNGKYRLSRRLFVPGI